MTIDAATTLDASADGATKDAASKDAAGKDSEDEVVATGDGTSAVYCGSPNDCATAETCGADGTCHAGDCAATPCINQFQCAATQSGSACVHGDSHACGTDHQCLTSERCVAGHCTAIADLCTDQTQCPTSKVCDEGKCKTACTSDPMCPVGYKCRIALGVCDVPAKVCSVTSDCASKDAVCVDGACVPRCSASGACGNGCGLCVDNGCVPDEKPSAPMRRRRHTCRMRRGPGVPARPLLRFVRQPQPDRVRLARSTPLCKSVKLGSASLLDLRHHADSRLGVRPHRTAKT